MPNSTIKTLIFFSSLIGLLGACQPPTPPAPKANIGVISYWGADTTLYNQLPQGSLALVNPDSGIFTGQSTTLVPDLGAYQTIVQQQTARGVKMLGYVPTGYFAHGCNTPGQCQTWQRIEAQVQAYFANMPTLAGIFLDETAPSVWDCAAFTSEYQRLRDTIKKYKPNAQIVFNAGTPDTCVTNAANAGETVVLFESDHTAYTNQSQQIAAASSAAKAKGVLVWHLVHSVKTANDMKTVVANANTHGADYVYVTNIGGNWQAGENTWGSLPPYWAEEVALTK